MAQSRRDALKRTNQSLNGMDPVLFVEEMPSKKEPQEKEQKVETKVEKRVERTPKKEKAKEKVAITVCLPNDLSTYFTIKAYRSGKSIQEYFEWLIRKYEKKVDSINPFDPSLSKYRESKAIFIRRTLMVSSEVRDIIKESSSKMGMKIVDYTYYIVDQEKTHDKESPDFQ